MLFLLQPQALQVDKPWVQRLRALPHTISFTPASSTSDAFQRTENSESDNTARNTFYQIKPQAVPGMLTGSWGVLEEFHAIQYRDRGPFFSRKIAQPVSKPFKLFFSTGDVLRLLAAQNAQSILLKTFSQNPPLL